MTPIRFGITRRIGAFTAAVLLLLTVALGTATADDPETITTRLEPGLNFVGWVGPEIPVFELFIDVPEINVVHAWHAGQRAWQSASPRVPPSLHTLHWLRPGMGLVVEIEGEDPVEWTRPFVAAGAPLWISAGVNLIAWTGPDGYAINGLEDRFGASLLNTWAWDPEKERYDVYAPRPADSANRTSTLKRGDSLWIEVSERGAGPWVLYSDSLAVIRGRMTGPNGTGLAGIRLNARYTSALIGDGGFRGVTNWDGSFHMYAEPGVAHDVSFHNNRGPGCTLFYNNGAATPKRSQSTPVRPFGGIPVELPIHVPDAACGWEIRGKLLDSAGSPLSGRQIYTSLRGSSLSSASAVTASDGSFAVLTEGNGPNRLHVQLADECPAYYRDGAVTLERHLASPIQITDAHVDNVIVTVPADICRWHIRGTVVDHDGMSLEGKYVGIWSADPDYYASFLPLDRDYTAQDGSFSVRVPTNGAYYVRVSHGVACRSYHRRGGAVSSRYAAEIVEVQDMDVIGLRFVAPLHWCELAIKGTISHDESAGAFTMYAAGIDGSWRYVSISSDGSFSGVVPAGGFYRLMLQFRKDELSCTSYYRADGATYVHEEATLVEVGTVNLTGIHFAVPKGTCNQVIAGRVTHYYGGGLSHTSLSATIDGDGESGHTNSDGYFSIPVRGEGGYRLKLTLPDDCVMYYKDGGVTTSQSDASLIHVGSEDVNDIIVTVPANVCGKKMYGRIVDLGDAGLGGIGLRLDGSSNDVYYSNADGSFAIPFAKTGDYRLELVLGDGCRVYYAGGGRVSTSRHAAAVFTRLYRDITVGRLIRVPENPCG